MNAYLSTKYTHFLTLNQHNAAKPEKIENGKAEGFAEADSIPRLLSSTNSIDITSSLESLLFFSEYRPCTVHCFIPLLSYVVDLLEESVDRALHAVGDCGAVGWQSIQAVSERVCVVYAMLRDCTTIMNMTSSSTASTNGMNSTIINENMSEELVEGEQEENDGIIEDRQLARAVCRASDCLFKIMEKGTLPKECMASAAVALCTAFTLPNVKSTAVAADIAAGLLMGSKAASLAFSSSAALPPQGWVSSYLVKEKNSSLHTELQSLGPIAALCMLRAFLQSTPTADLIVAVFPRTSPVGNEQHDREGARSRYFLTDGVVCTLCNAIDASVDLKFKTMALQTLLICVEHLIRQWKKESSSSGKDSKKKMKQKKENTQKVIVENELKIDSSGDSSPKLVLTSSQQQLLLRVLWQSWDDSQVNAWRLAYQQFARLLTLIDLQKSDNSSVFIVSKEDFFVSVAKDLLALGPEQKRRYCPLAALIPHIGAEKLLSLHPKLVSETLAAMAYNAALTSPATLMLSVLWSKLWEETAAPNNSDDDIGAANRVWQGHWVPQITDALCSTDEAARKVACAYAVPALAETEPKVLEILFREVAVQATEDVAVSSLAK